MILSLVYVGGAILASKRSPYQDLINSGFDPLVLGERLQRQHKLICAAVKAGRIDDLKRLSQGDADEQAAPKSAPRTAAAKATAKTREAAPAAPAAAETSAPKIQTVEDEADILALEDGPAEYVPTASPPQAPAKKPAPLPRLVGKQQEDEFIQVEAEGALHLTLMEEREFHAGEVVTIRVRVSRGVGNNDVSAANVPVTVKILGTEFRPLILSSRSDADGVATIHAWLPRFTKGRAAVLVRAIVDGFSAELRRVIHQP